MANRWPPLPQPSGELASIDTLEQWLELPEDSDGEWVDGRLEEEEAPDATHELAVSWLIGVLGAWLHSSGFVFGSGLKVLTATNRGRKPDLVALLPGSARPPRRGPLRAPPDLIVEVVSPSPRDVANARGRDIIEPGSHGDLTQKGGRSPRPVSLQAAG